MNNWIFFILIAEFVWSFCSLIDKFVISKEHIKSPFVYIILNGLMNVFLIFVIPFTGFKLLSPFDILIAVFAGSMYTAGVIIYYKSVQYDEISRISVLNQLSPVFILILSFFIINEKLSWTYIIGFSLLLLAGLMVSYRKTNKSFRIGKAFWLMSLSMIFASIGAIAAKHTYSATDFWNSFVWLRLSSFTALGVLLVPSIRKETSRTFTSMKPKIKSLMSFKMIIDFSAFIFSGYAISHAPVSLVTALASSVHPMFVFMFALIASVFFPQIIKEEISLKIIGIKILALLIVILGIIFINL